MNRAFRDNGDYVVRVVVTDNDGQIDWKEIDVAVAPGTPTAQIGVPAGALLEGQSAVLTGNPAKTGFTAADFTAFKWTVTRNGAAWQTATTKDYEFKPGDGGIYAFTDVAKHGTDKAGDRVTLDGDNNAIELNKTNARSRTDTNQIGDGNNTGPSDANASGPDKSSVTNNELAAEEPVVEEPKTEEPEGEFVPTDPPDFPDGPVEIPGPEAAE